MRNSNEGPRAMDAAWFGNELTAHHPPPSTLWAAWFGNENGMNAKAAQAHPFITRGRASVELSHKLGEL